MCYGVVDMWFMGVGVLVCLLVRVFGIVLCGMCGGMCEWVYG